MSALQAWPPNVTKQLHVTTRWDPIRAFALKARLEMAFHAKVTHFTLNKLLNTATYSNYDGDGI